MKKIITAIFLLLCSFHVFANRYIEDGIGSSSGGFFDVIIGFVLGIAALFYFADSFSKWNARQAKGEKPEPKDGVGDWIFTLIGYALVSIFACMPILAIFKIIGGAAFVREYWHLAFFLCFGVLTFLKRT